MSERELLPPRLRLLLVEDDEDDFLLTRDLLAEVRGTRFEVDWARSYAEGLRRLSDGAYDLVLLDYHLGGATGLDFLREIGATGDAPPAILLTGQADEETDLAALRAGATDYLDKAGLTALLLARAVRYAVERGHAQADRRSAELRYQHLVESVGAIVWRGDAATLQFTFVSREAEHLLGYPVERWTREPTFWADHLHPEDREWALALCREAGDRGEPHTFEYRMVAADGRVVWLRDIVRPVQVAGRRELAGVMVDVTPAKEAEEKLRLRDRALAAVSEGIVITDPHRPDNPIVSVNPAFEAMTGYTAAEALGRNCRFLQGPGSDPATVARVRAAIAAGAPVQAELLNYRKDGTPFWNRLSISPVRDAAGRLTHLVGVQEDVTEARARDSRMRLFAAALENLEESVNVLDERGRIVYANAAHCRMLGCEPDAWPGDGILAFSRDDAARREFVSVLEQVRAGAVWRGVVDLRRADGQLIRVSSHMERVEQEGRTLVFSICHDVGAELEQEQRLRRAERLASIGTLVSGVAHELNNPLAAIVGFTQLLLMDERPATEREDLETIGREAQRMAEIVSNLRLLSRGTQEETRAAQPVDLGDVVRHVLRTRGYALRTHNVEVREDVDPDLPAALGDRVQLEQVVLNLVVNAEQAMAGRDEPGLLVVRLRRSRGGVSLQVVDNGAGIAPEHLDRIFDPFFTTKRPGEGTGLGLSLVHSIVEEHGGQIHVDSRLGAGTAFRIELPAAADAVDTYADGAAAAEAEPPRPLRVLVVDDEEPVRRVLVRYLATRGHAVDEAVEGGAGLALLDAAAAAGRPYDVVVSDLRMPGLSGTQLLARLRERGGGMERRLVFLTGDTAGREVERIRAETDLPVLTKPVRLDALAAVVERAVP